MHKQFIIGRLAQDPLLSQSNKSMVFSIISTNWRDKDTEKEFGGSERFNCVFFGKEESVIGKAGMLEKGAWVCVEARRKTDEYKGESRVQYIVEDMNIIGKIQKGQ